MKRFFFVFIIFVLNLYSQDRSDFFDPFDHNLRNYQGKSGFGVDDKEFQEYTLPPKSQNPNSLTGSSQNLITPKNVQIPQTFSSLLINPISNTGSQRKVSPNVNNPSVNPLTGEVNTEAMLKAQQEKKVKQEKLKELKKNRKIKPYTETKFRRMQIVFFLTLPFSALFSYGFASVYGEYLNNVRNGNLPGYFPKSHRRFQNTFEGGIFMLTGAVTLAMLNAYVDSKRVEEYKNTKAKQSVLLNTISPDNQEFYPQIYFLKKM